MVAALPPETLKAEPSFRRVLPADENGSPLFALCRTWVCEAGRVDEVRERRREKRNGKRRESGPERWARWQRMLDEGVYASRAELARAEGVSRAAVTMGLRKLSAGHGG
jgi:hypothetical protein